MRTIECSDGKGRLGPYTILIGAPRAVAAVIALSSASFSTSRAVDAISTSGETFFSTFKF